MSWTLIESQTLGSSVASVTLGSGGTIPQTYKTLKLVASARGTYPYGTATSLTFQFNGSGGTAYSDRFLYGSGSSAGSGSRSSQAFIRGTALTVGTATANTFGSMELLIPNYSGNTTKCISFDGVTETNATEAYQELTSGLWTGTSPITSITVGANVDNFTAGSTFYLYGLR